MFNPNLETSLKDVVKITRKKKHQFITIEHLLLVLLDNPDVSGMFTLFSANIDRIKTNLILFIEKTCNKSSKTISITEPTIGFQRVIQRTVFQAQCDGRSEITGADVISSILNEKSSQANYFLRQENIERENINSYITNGVIHSRLIQPGIMRPSPSIETIVEPGTGESIDSYTVNINEQIRQGKIDPVIGREDELERAIQVLCRRKKNNPLFIGEAGVGKTALAEGIAWKIIERGVPKMLLSSTVYSLDLGIMLAGTKYRGDFEKRFKSVLKEFQSIPGAILFIDEIHSLVGAGSASGGSLDAANLIKPLLSKGLNCMGATTYNEYRNVFQKDNALQRRFEKIDVKETTTEETLLILKGLRPKFESYHKVKYTTSSLKAAVELSQRYLNDRFLPDKAIDIIDDVGAAYTMKKQPCTKNIIDRHDVEKIVAKIAQVPCKQINISDRKLLSNLDDKIKRMVYGQDNAIGKVVNAIKLSRSGLNSPNKPAGCFFFNGPTGVGKTEVAIQLAKCLGLKLIRFDMSEFMEKHTSSQLVGAPAGYVGFEQGGLLTESIIKHPHSILLLDEIEKSHPEIVNLLLQIMDYGKLTDNNGRSADFQNVTIIMTSNTGAKNLVNQNIGFMDQDNSSEGDIAVKKNFPPEFRNRLDAIVQFNSLDDKSILLVINKFITQLEVQLESQKIHLEVSESVKHWIASEGYQEGMGARPISRVIDQEIKRIIADKIIMGDMPSGSTIKVSLHNNTVKVRANSH